MPSFDDTSLASVVTRLGSARKLKFMLSHARRREIQHQVRSPLLASRSDSSVSGSVPLEFDKEDEDFLGGGVCEALLDAPVPVPKQRDGSSVWQGTSRDDAMSVDSSLSASSASVNIDDGLSFS